MCTLSVVTRDDGYLLGMNRDEKIARGPGVVPKVHDVCGITAVFPGDGGCGTWIGANEFGIALALLNWNDVVPVAGETRYRRSRGQVIPSVIRCASAGDADSMLSDARLQGLPPFRLVGIFPSEKQICEWRWDSARIESLGHSWMLRHWFSSSLSDKRAKRLRGLICAAAGDESDAGSKLWLRRLHASHQGGRGPFSLCVHRADVETLSYSEINSTQSGVFLNHLLGSPCCAGRFNEIRIERRMNRATPRAQRSERGGRNCRPKQNSRY